MDTALETSPSSAAPAPRSYLNEAMAAAQARALAVLKKGDDPRYGKGTLASTETIMQVVKEANDGLGLSYRPKRCPIIRNAAGEPIAIERVITIMHSSGEREEVSTEWPVERKLNRDGKVCQTWDDAVATAQTRSLGYLLRDAWGLPRLKKEDMPPGVVDDPEETAEAPDAWTIRKGEWNALAKAAIKAGVPKSNLVEAITNLGGAINAEGVWGAEPGGTVAKEIDAYLKLIATPTRPAATSAPAAQRAASAAPTAAPPSSRTTASPTTAAPASASGVGAADRPVPVSREKLDQLAAAVAAGITMYGISKKEMVVLLRAWSKSPTMVDEGGKFSQDVTPEQWRAAVTAFKLWEVETRAAKERAASMTPEQVAEEEAAKWEASQAAAAPQ